MLSHGKELGEPHSSMGFSKKIVSGGAWSLGVRGLQQGLNIMRIIIIARLLSPTDIGLFGVALLVLTILDSLSRTGFQEALIQKKNITKGHLDTAWTLLAMRGAIISALLFVLAPIVADFFGAPEATGLVQVIGISTLVQGLSNIGMVLYQKELNFKKLFYHQSAGTVTDFIVSVSLAIILANPWAIVFGTVAGSIVRTIGSYVLHPYRPHLNLDMSKGRELYTFGRWVFLSGILVLIITHGDDFAVGKIAGVAALGIYQMAYTISCLPATELISVVHQVAFPAYSKLQNSIRELKAAYLRVTHLSAFLTFYAAGAIVVAAPEFTRLFLGQTWEPIIPVMQILVWWGLIRGLVGTMSPIFMSLGKPELATKLQAIQAVLMLITIAPLTLSFGAIGAAVSVLISAIGVFFVRSTTILKVIGCHRAEFFRPLVATAIITAASIITTIIIKQSLAGNGDAFLFIVSAASFTALYFLLSLVASAICRFECLEIARSTWRIYWSKGV